MNLTRTQDPAPRTASPSRPAPADGALTGVLRAGGLALIGITILGAALRIPTLGVQSFWDDELFTAWLVKMPFGHLLSTVPETERTPHLFYILEWVCGQLFGTGEFGLRILPAILGVLTIPVIYAIVAMVASRRAALAAAVFAAVNPFLIWYSQEARAYGLLIFMVAVSLMFLAAYVRGGRPASLAGWAVASALAVASHYFALFLIVPEVVWVLARAFGPLRRRLAMSAVPVLATAALVPLMVHQRNAVSDRLASAGRDVGERLLAIPKNFLVGFAIPGEAVAVVLACGAALVALWLALARAGGGEDRRRVHALAGLAVCGVALPLIIAPLGFDYLQSRNTMAVLVPLAVLLGCGFVVGRAGPVALAVLCAVSIATVVGVDADAKYQRRDWRGAARALGPVRESRLLTFSPPFKRLGPFRVYFGDETRFPPSIRRPLPPVREVAAVALAQFSGFGPGADRTPPGPVPEAPPGFHLVREVKTSTYRLAIFRAPRAISLRWPDLGVATYRKTAAVGLWQPFRRR